jgi:hypothetical protein
MSALRQPEARDEQRFSGMRAIAAGNSKIPALCFATAWSLNPFRRLAEQNVIYGRVAAQFVIFQENRFFTPAFSSNWFHLCPRS